MAKLYASFVKAQFNVIIAPLVSPEHGQPRVHIEILHSIHDETVLEFDLFVLLNQAIGGAELMVDAPVERLSQAAEEHFDLVDDAGIACGNYTLRRALREFRVDISTPNGNGKMICTTRPNWLHDESETLYDLDIDGPWGMQIFVN